MNKDEKFSYSEQKVDLSECSFEYHLRYAKEGYVDDAVMALDWAILILKEESSIPDYLRDYLFEGLEKLLDAKTCKSAFYLQAEGRGKIKETEKRERDHEIARRMIIDKYYDNDGNKRESPLSDEYTIFNASESYNISASSIRNAYYDYKNLLKTGHFSK